MLRNILCYTLVHLHNRNDVHAYSIIYNFFFFLFCRKKAMYFERQTFVFDFTLCNGFVINFIEKLKMVYLRQCHTLELFLSGSIFHRFYLHTNPFYDAFKLFRVRIEINYESNINYVCHFFFFFFF